MKKYLYLALGIIIAAAGSALAYNISVPSAPASGYGLISTTTGAYIATSTVVTVSSTGVATQAAFFTSSNKITSDSSFYWDNTNKELGIGGTPGSAKLYVNGSIGVASTTPWGLLSLNPDGITGPEFVIGSSTRTHFVVNTNGNIGIGNTSPTYLLDVMPASNVNADLFRVASSTGTTGNGLYVKTSGRVGIGTTTPWAQLSVNPNGIGSGPELAIGSSTSTHFVVTNAGNVGIGTANPQGNFELNMLGSTPNSALISAGNDNLLMVGNTNTAPGFSIIAAGAGTGNRGVFKAIRSRGTNTSPTAVASGDDTFSLLSGGYDGSATKLSAEIKFTVDGTVSSSVVPQSIIFNTTNSSAARAETMRLTSAGFLGIGTTTPISKFTVSNTPLGAGAVATTTVDFGDYATTTSTSCFNVKNTAGTAISFYFIGTTQIIENNRCR